VWAKKPWNLSMRSFDTRSDHPTMLRGLPRTGMKTSLQIKWRFSRIYLLSSMKMISSSMLAIEISNGSGDDFGDLALRQRTIFY